MDKLKPAYVHVELRRDLRKGLRTVASDKDIEQRQLLNQIVERFLNGRIKMLEPNGESQQ